MTTTDLVPTAAQSLNEQETRDALAALLFWPDPQRAVYYLREIKGIELRPKQLSSLRRHNEKLYQEIAAEMAPHLEKALVSELLATAMEASELEREAIRKARRRVRSGEDDRPATTAREASQVKTQALDKRDKLLGRPGVITEKRDYNEIIRQLEGLKVLKRVELEPEVVE